MFDETENLIKEITLEKIKTILGKDNFERFKKKNYLIKANALFKIFQILLCYHFLEQLVLTV